MRTCFSCNDKNFFVYFSDYTSPILKTVIREQNSSMAAWEFEIFLGDGKQLFFWI